jgi:hypothetical protein
MMNMNPAKVAANRTARLVREAKTPVYTSVTKTAAQENERIIRAAQEAACTEDFCFVCSRATDHFGEHSDEQLLAWAKTPFAHRLMR